MINKDDVIVKMHDLDFQYRQDGFRLQVPKLSFSNGHKVAVVGPSGCGKTTFLKLLAGIHVPQHGTLTVDGIDINRLADNKRREFRISRIGFVFQDFELLDYLSVLENILLPFRINSALCFDTEIKNRAIRLAADVGLADKIKQRPKNLSHGEKQRVAIARALIIQPKILLADEPTGNLDPKNKQHIKNLLFEQASQTRAALFFVTHDHSLLRGFDHVIDFDEFVQGGSR